MENERLCGRYCDVKCKRTRKLFQTTDESNVRSCWFDYSFRMTGHTLNVNPNKMLPILINNKSQFLIDTLEMQSIYRDTLYTML